MRPLTSLAVSVVSGLVLAQGRQPENAPSSVRPGSTSTTKDKSISQWGITWTFDQPHTVGRFVNGDWWVLGPVTVVSVDPAPENGFNGSMVNPVTGPSQAYDLRIKYYDKKKAATFPLELAPNKSLVSTVSLHEPCKDLRGVRISPSHCRLRTAAVLTVLGKCPPADCFRPPFVGDRKPLYEAAKVRKKALPRLKPPFRPPSIAFFERGFERVWLQHLTDWACRMMHPAENMLNYYREINFFYGEASLLLLLDRPRESKDKLLIRMVQQGIDQYFTAIHGAGGRSLNKFSILFAGTMLDEPEMYNVFVEKRNKHAFNSDKQTYYPKDSQSKLTSSVVPAGQGWTGASVLWRVRVGQENEQLHPSEWKLLGAGSSGAKSETYRHCCTSWTWVGMCLAARLLGMQEKWNHPAYFDYIDRWMTEDFEPFAKVIRKYYPNFRSSAGSAGSKFVREMWRTYRGK